jgi:hypothetical protein
VAPEAEGRSLTENMSFSGFSSSLRRPNHLATVGGILVFRGLAAIFAGLEFAGLDTRRVLQAKALATPHSNLTALCQSIAAE